MLAVKIRVKLHYPGGVYNTKRITLNIRLYQNNPYLRTLDCCS